MRLFGRVCAGACFAALSICTAETASAAAMAGVNSNTFRLFWTEGSVIDGIPFEQARKIANSLSFSLLEISDHINVIQRGNAKVTYGDGIPYRFSDFSISARAEAVEDGYAFVSFERKFRISIFNSSSFSFNILRVGTEFSAFNPFGAGFGATVDDANREYARFASSQSGPGIGDNHACDTRNRGSSSLYQEIGSSRRCGVQSPDFSSLEFSILDFRPNDVEELNFSLKIVAEVSSVSEPASGTLFGFALATMAAVFGARRAIAAGVTQLRQHASERQAMVVR